jgi:hypothetical protein
MKYQKMSLKSAVPLILAAIVILLMVSCASVYHGYLMKGSIIESNSEIYLCIGSKDGASVGQEFEVYKIVQGQSKANPFKRELAGKVKITEIIDEHFAKATVISGKAEKGDIVELTRPK